MVHRVVAITDSVRIDRFVLHPCRGLRTNVILFLFFLLAHLDVDFAVLAPPETALAEATHDDEHDRSNETNTLNRQTVRKVFSDLSNNSSQHIKRFDLLFRVNIPACVKVLALFDSHWDRIVAKVQNIFLCALIHF